MARYLQLDIQFTKAILPLVKCDTCTCRLKSFTPENVKSENKVCTYGQISYNCWFQNCENPCLSRRCGAIYDIIQNHESTPSKLNRKNTHSQKGTADPWSIDKCFINAPGYNHKTSSTDSDWTTLFQVRDHSDNNFYLCSDIMAILQDCMEHVNQPNFHQAEQNQEIKELKRLWVGDSHKLQQPENEKAKTDDTGKCINRPSDDPSIKQYIYWTFQKNLHTTAKYDLKYTNEALTICMTKSKVINFLLSPDIHVYHQIRRHPSEKVMEYIWFPDQKIKQQHEKICTAGFSCMKTEIGYFEILHITEWISTFYKHTFKQFPKQLQLSLVPILIKLINTLAWFGYFELELNHIDFANVSALTSRKIISKKKILNRVISKSFCEKDKEFNMQENHRKCENELKMTNDTDEISKSVKSGIGPTVCVYEHINNNSILESEGENTEHFYLKAQRGFPDNIQNNEKNPSIIINQGHECNGATVDLKSQRASSQLKESHKSVNEDSILKKDDMDKDSLKNVVCHGNRMLSGNSNITIFPASGNGKGISEKPLGTNNTLNDDNDHSFVRNRNSSSFRDEAVPFERISSNNPDVDGHTSVRGASGLAGTDGFSKIPPLSKLDVNGQENCQRVTEQKVEKLKNSGEISSTTPSQKSDSGNVAEFSESDLPNSEVERSEHQMFEPLMQIIDKMADGERVSPQITMRYEMLRFCTLRSFPKHNKPFITRLAAAGFYYANTNDEVVCYSCARRKRNWCEDDNPMEIHRQLNPNCSFLLKNSEVNVPVRMSEIHHNITRTTHSQNPQNITHAGTGSFCSSIPHNTSASISQPEVTSSHSIQNIKQTLSSPGNLSSYPGDSAGNKFLGNRMHQRAYDNFVQTMTPSPGLVEQQLQINHMTFSGSSHDIPVVNPSSAIPKSQLSIGGNNISTGPKYPKYATKTARLTSFNDCGDIIIPPDNLATSGFFYAGFGDCVRCFQCGVGLRHWSYEDDPWIEHCRWSKDCLFVKQVKGQEFVNLVQMAVQYSQNTTSGNITGTKTQSSEDAVMEQQMHTNAAQSVLEMGYNPNVIRIAIRALKDANEGQTLTAATLMEKIFELEDEALDSLEHSQLVQGTPPSQQNTRSAQNTDSNNTQRVSLDTSSVSSKNVSTQSVSFDDASSSAGCLIQKTSKAQSKKSQLLEQQKLKQENEQLKQQSMCTKCKKNDVSIVFLPCGHLVTCETCAPSVRYCSVQDCGKYVKGTVRTYLA